MIEKNDILLKKVIIQQILTEWIILIIISFGLVFLTAGVHSIGIPLYKINPMHWVLYSYILFRQPKYSSIIIISILMPLSSVFLTGHPLVVKGVLMAIELAVYGSIFGIIINKSSKYFIPAFIISQVFGKTVYYSIKYLMIKFALIDGIIFTTSLMYQLIISIVIMLTIFGGMRIRNSLKNSIL